MSQTSHAPRFIATEKAAGYCGFSPRTFEKLRVTGGGPCYIKRGRRVLYAIADLDNWMLAGLRRTTSDQVGA